MRVVRLVAAIVAAGGRVQGGQGRLVCRMPQGESLPPELATAITADKALVLAALEMADLEETVRHILALREVERQEYRAAVAFDLAALAEAEFRLTLSESSAQT